MSIDNKEIRKAVETAIHKPLKEVGFKRLGKSKWIRRSETGKLHQIVYLQRSTCRHCYYIEVGEYDDKCLKGGIPDIVYCYHETRMRINGIVITILGLSDSARNSGDEAVRINNALDFEGVENKEDCQQKIHVINEFVKEYIPKWFEIRNRE